MLPIQILKRFSRPGSIEKQFLNYLDKAKLNIDNSKTIAYISYYDQLRLSTAGVVNFFQGQADQFRTNVGNSFTRPQSEHAFIYAIRFWTGDSENPIASVWSEGASNAEIQNSRITITNNNVVVLKNYPMTDFLNSLTTKDNGMITLDQPILWAGQTDLKLTLSTASGVYAAGQSGRFELIGLGLI